ncbi:hypothetical protein Tco_0115347 [Tanacetum coccineum]
MSKGNDTRVRKPTWNNVHRVNKQNQFVPLAVQTRTGNNPVHTAKASSTKKVSTARQKVNRQTVLTSTALKVKTVKPNVNDGGPANVFHKIHSPSSRPFKRTTVLKTKFSNQKVYTVKVKEVSTVGEKWVTAVKSSAGCKWRTPGYNNNILSKYNGGSSLRSENQAKPSVGQQETNQNIGTKDKIDAGDSEKEDESAQDCFELPIWHSYSSTNPFASKSKKEQTGAAKSSSTNIFSTVSTTLKLSVTNLALIPFSIPVITPVQMSVYLISEQQPKPKTDDFEKPPLRKIHEDTIDGILYTCHLMIMRGAEADYTKFGNSFVECYPIPTSRIIPSHPSTTYSRRSQHSSQTRSQSKQKFLSSCIFEDSKVWMPSEICLWEKGYRSNVGLAKSMERKEEENVRNKARLGFPNPKVSRERPTSGLKLKIGCIKAPRAWSMIGSLMYVTLQGLTICMQSVACSKNPQYEDVNFLAEDSFTWQCKKATIVATLQPARPNICYYSKLLWQSKNTLVKHFEDMRICRPFKEYLQVWFNPPRDGSMSCLTIGAVCTSKVTLFVDTMLVQPTQDEGVSSERLSAEHSSPSPAPTSEVPNESLPDSTSTQPSEEPYEQQPDPSPRPSPQPSPTPIVPDSIPEPTGENLGDHSSNDTSLLGNEDDMTLPNVYDLCISLCKQVSDQAKEIKLLKAQITKLKKQAKPVIKHFKEYLKTVSLQKRLSKKSSSKKQRMHKRNVSKQGRKIAKGESSVQRNPMFDVMPEDNIDHMEADNAQSEGRTKEMVDEDKELDEDRLSTEDGVSTVKERVSTDLEKVSTDFEKVSTDKPLVSTDGSKVSTDKQIEGADDQVEEEWELRVKRIELLKKKATNEALIKNFDDIKARIEQNRILAEGFKSKKESSKFYYSPTIRRKELSFLHDTIAAQRKFLAQQ